VNILLVISAPNTLSLALPPADKNGKTTATPAQIAIHDDLMSIDAQWTLCGATATRNMFVVGTRSQTLAEAEALIAKHHLPLRILHAQDAFSVTAPDPADATKTITTTTVHKQGVHSTLLGYMPAVVTYNPDGTVKTTAKATAVTLPSAQGQAPWHV